MYLFSFLVKTCKDPPQSVHHVQPKSKEGHIVSRGGRPTTTRSNLCEDLSNVFDVDLNTTNHEVTEHESYLAGIVDTSLIPSKESELPFDLEAPMPCNTQFHLDLLNILSQHHTDLKVHDEIILVIKRHSNDQSLTFSSHNLKTRSSLLKDLEWNMDTSKLKPKDVDVNLTFGRQATISVFDLETMIMSLLTDPTPIQPKNIAHGYDLFTGKYKGNNTDDRYGEIHTGDAWEPA
jgi:hypothetical protein